MNELTSLNFSESISKTDLRTIELIESRYLKCNRYVGARRTHSPRSIGTLTFCNSKFVVLLKPTWTLMGNRYAAQNSVMKFCVLD